MYSHKALPLLLALIVMAGCQTKPVEYALDTVIRPMPMVDEYGRPRQYVVDFTVTETGPNGESLVTRPQILTVVGRQAEIAMEELHTNELPGRISCTAFVEHNKEGSKVDTSVTIVKKGKEVCILKQSAILPQIQGPNKRLD